MAKTGAFNNHLPEYEQWFSDNHFVFLSELNAIRSVLPENKKGVEIGVGSGIFASELGILEGCDPSEAMRNRAAKRNIAAIECVAENLPYQNKSFDFALLVTTICFVDDPEQTLREINRILKTGGEIIMAFVDKDSLIGKQYLQHKEKSIFYKEAIFYSTKELLTLLEKAGFKIEQTVQTIFNPLEEINETQNAEPGNNKGSFVVIKAKKHA